MKIIKDIFIGNFRVSQRFGKNPQMYSKFGMKGHNGIDFATPIGSELVCCFDEAQLAFDMLRGTGIVPQVAMLLQDGCKDTIINLPLLEQKLKLISPELQEKENKIKARKNKTKKRKSKYY